MKARRRSATSLKGPFSPSPWGEFGQDAHVSVGPCRPTLLTLDESTAPRIQGQVLPLVAHHSTGKLNLSRWELPSTSRAAAAADSLYASEYLRAEWDGGTADAEVNVEGLLYPPEEDEPSRGEIPEKAATPSDAALQSIRNHMDAMHEVLGASPPDDAFAWPRPERQFAVRELRSALQTWNDATRRTQPPYSLIVRLAEELPRLIQNVCQQPRMVLSRQRRMHPIHRVQQMDAACLRWLARQPGRTPMEQAGPRQEVLALVREEKCDTFENRLVRELMVRARQECRVYLRRYRPSQPDHPRIRLVRDFERLLHGLMRTSEVGSLPGLSGPAKPNYVLQHDRRYAPLWTAYQQIMRQQLELEMAWRWRQRVWAENCVITTLDYLVRNSPADTPRGDLVLNRNPTHGTYNLPPQVPALVTDEYRIELVHGHEQYAQHPEISTDLAWQSPDCILVVRQGGTTRRVAFWALLDFEFDRWGPLLEDTLIPQLKAEGTEAVVVAPILEPPTDLVEFGCSLIAWNPQQPSESLDVFTAALNARLRGAMQ